MLFQIILSISTLIFKSCHLNNENYLKKFFEYNFQTLAPKNQILFFILILLYYLLLYLEVNYPHFIKFFSLLFQIILIISPFNPKSCHLNKEIYLKRFFENNY